MRLEHKGGERRGPALVGERGNLAPVDGLDQRVALLQLLLHVEQVAQPVAVRALVLLCNKTCIYKFELYNVKTWQCKQSICLESVQQMTLFQ